MMGLFNARRQGISLMPHSAGIMADYGAMSYEKFIVDLEIMAWSIFF